MSDPHRESEVPESTDEGAGAASDVVPRQALESDIAVSKTVAHLESPTSDVQLSEARASVPEGPAPSSALPASADPGALVGTVLAGRYRIEQHLGSGGMGSVYRAEHVHMRKSFAIKVLHRDLTFQPEVVARFEREAVAAARIDHPHVAAATDFGRLEDGACYLALEFVQGKALSALLREERRLSQERALHIAHQIVEALAAAHALGIVHRDLKPDNVMLIDKDGEADFVKVLDFGIAKVRMDDTKGQQLTQAGSIFGTPEYMAPEQAQGIEVDARADLYTLGIVLYEMLAGQTPFHDGDLVVVLTRQLTMEPPPLPDSVDPRIRQIVRRLLRKDPSERYQAATDVVSAIEVLAKRSEAPPRDGDEMAHNATLPSSHFIEVATAMSARGIELARRANVGAWVSRTARPIVGRDGVLRRRLKLGRFEVPLWVPAVLAIAAVFLLVVSSGTPSAPTNQKPGIVSRLAAAAKGALDPELAGLIERAKNGDRTAIAELAGRPAEKRGAEEWRALARGYYLIHSYAPSAQAYAQAIRLDASIANDSEVISSVREMAASSDGSDAALDLAANQLGERGADLIYDVWSESRDRKLNNVTLRARTLLDSDSVTAHASPALRIALDLQRARGCPAYKALLSRAVTDADERSYSSLNKLRAQGGCGFFGLGDCYSCLRRGSDLSDAIAAAKDRKAPAFEHPSEASSAASAAGEH